MINKKFSYLFLILLTVLTFGLGCNPWVSRKNYLPIKRECNIPIVRESPFTFPDSNKLGDIKISDTGLSLNCGPEDVEKILREEGCLLGANLINVLEVKPPDTWSTCYRVKAEFIRMDSTMLLYQDIVRLNSFRLRQVNRYIEDIPFDSLRVPEPQIRFAVGFDLLQPSIALNSYLFYKNIGLSYAYGLPASSPRKTDWIRDIKYAHHFQINLTIAVLKNYLRYNPIYIGLGKTYIKEKSEVQGFTGDGNITAYNYFIGFRWLYNKEPFFEYFGTKLEVGFCDWNFSNSLLKKSNSEIDYRYNKIYFSIGLCYYIY